MVPRKQVLSMLPRVFEFSSQSEFCSSCLTSLLKMSVSGDVCSYVNCYKTSIRNPGITMHRFPTNPDVAKQWVRQVNRILDGVTKITCDNEPEAIKVCAQKMLEKRRR